MQLIPLRDIQVGSNRQRRVFDPALLTELQASIEQQGLLLPLVVRYVEGKPVLVAGERRLRVLRDMAELGMGYQWEGDLIDGVAPCVELGELSPIDALQAEYDENVVRTDLTWQEKAVATEMLMRLRSAQAAAKGLPTPTPREIGEERYLTQELVPTDNETIVARETAKQELVVAKYLDDPEIKAAPGLRHAFRLVQRREEAARHAKIAQQLGPTYGRHSHTLLNDNSLVWLARTDPDQFACICTDPPYGVGADEYGDSGGMSNLPHGYDDGPEAVAKMYGALAPLLFKVARSDAHLYMFCDIDWFCWLKDQLSAAGWRCFRTPLVWHKPQGMRAPWPQQGPQRKYELILYAIKGGRPCNRLGGDVLSYPSDDNLGHAAQKPVALFADLLGRSCLPGDRVLDPFAGTGTVIPAAHGLKLYATAIEMDQVHYGTALKRLTELT